MSVMYIDINAISLYIDLNIFQQDECFCSKLGMDMCTFPILGNESVTLMLKIETL